MNVSRQVPDVRIDLAILVLAAFFVLAGGVVIGVSLLPYATVKARVDALAPSGSYPRLTPALFASAARSTRESAGGLLVVAVLLLAFRARAASLLAEFLASSRRSTSALLAWIAGTFRAEQALHVATLAFLTAIAVSVRTLFLAQPIRFDEAYTITRFASKPIYIALAYYPVPNNHLFYTLFARIMYVLFGNQPSAIRLPAFIAGVLLVPATYIVARLFYNKRVGVLTAAFVAGSSVLIEYSTSARGYTLLVLLFMLLLALAVYLRRSDEIAPWLAFSLLSALGFYTIPIMLYPFGIVCVWLGVSIWRENPPEHRRPLFVRMAVALAVAAMLTLFLYLPVLVTSGWRAVAANRFVAPRDWTVFFLGLPRMAAGTFREWSRDVSLVFVVAIAAGIGTTIRWHRRISRHPVSLAFAAAVWVVPVLAAQRVIPFARVWLFALPLVAMFGLAGVVYLLRALDAQLGPRAPAFWAAVPILLALALALNVLGSGSVLASTSAGTLPDGEKISLLLKAVLREGDQVIAPNPSDEIVAYYFWTHGIPKHYLTASARDARRVFVVVNTQNHQTIESVWRAFGMTVPSPPSPRLIARFPSADVYEVLLATSP
jgi:hypothetical protein